MAILKSNFTVCFFVLLLIVGGCSDEPRPDAAEPPVYSESETEMIPGAEIPDRPETYNDFTDQAHLLVSASAQLQPGDSMAVAMPLPTGEITFVVREKTAYDERRELEGSVSAPHGGFFEIAIQYGQLRGFIQTNDPRAAYQIYHQPDTDTYELQPLTDRDQLDGSAPLTPPYP